MPEPVVRRHARAGRLASDRNAGFRAADRGLRESLARAGFDPDRQNLEEAQPDAWHNSPGEYPGRGVMSKATADTHSIEETFGGQAVGRFDEVTALGVAGVDR